MSVLNVGFGILGVTFWALYLIRRLRPLNIGALPREIEREGFRKVDRTWRTPFLTLQPISILRSMRHQVYYFRTESLDGCSRESLMISRLLFAPLHVFYDNGKVTKVTGGAVKFEIFGNEAKTAKNLEKLLKVIQAKHREVATNPLLN